MIILASRSVNPIHRRVLREMGTRNTTRGDTNPNILPLLVLYGLALVQVGEDLPMPWKPRLLVILAAGVVLAWRAGPSPPRVDGPAADPDERARLDGPLRLGLVRMDRTAGSGTNVLCGTSLWATGLSCLNGARRLSGLNALRPDRLLRPRSCP